MKIGIDKLKYHSNIKVNKEMKEIKNILIEIKKRYKEFDKVINDYFTKFNFKYTNDEKDILINNILLAIIKEIEDYEVKFNNDDEYISYLKKTIYKIIPIILNNEKKLSVDTCFLYEPRNACCLYLLKSLNENVIKSITKLNNEEDSIIVLLLNNLIRVLISTLLLDSIGDDVHASGISRGAIEIFARIRGLNDDNIKEYINFVKLNAELQYYKKTETYDENTRNLELFKDQNPISGSQLENLLLNGWYRNKNGKRITKITDLIRNTLGEEFVKLYSTLSEFVHEDYILVAYDYVEMRFQSKKLIYELTMNLVNLFDDYLTFTSKDNTVYQYALDLKY